MVDFGALFNDRNFLNMLAGTGAGLDPEGVGGAVGKATQQYIRSLATQEAVAKEDAEKKRFNEQLLAILGGLTPKEMAGPTSMKIGPDKMTLDITRPGAIGGGAVAGGETNIGSQLTTSPGPTLPKSPTGYNLSDILPFF